MIILAVFKNWSVSKRSCNRSSGQWRSNDPKSSRLKERSKSFRPTWNKQRGSCSKTKTASKSGCKRLWKICNRTNKNCLRVHLVPLLVHQVIVALTRVYIYIYISNRKMFENASCLARCKSSLIDINILCFACCYLPVIVVLRLLGNSRRNHSRRGQNHSRRGQTDRSQEGQFSTDWRCRWKPQGFATNATSRSTGDRSER